MRGRSHHHAKTFDCCRGSRVRESRLFVNLYVITLTATAFNDFNHARCRQPRGAKATRRKPSGWEQNDILEDGYVRERDSRTQQNRSSADSQSRRTRKDEHTYKYFASCPPGLEKVLAAELGQPNIDAKMISPGHIGVAFEGDMLELPLLLSGSSLNANT
eukprot:138375-Prorocentrum_minimum.AAC.2